MAMSVLLDPGAAKSQRSYLEAEATNELQLGSQIGNRTGK